jgi:hypothetical protein
MEGGCSCFALYLLKKENIVIAFSYCSVSVQHCHMIQKL